jgi:uncharacterized cupredoxin-like copper-binding protein
LVLATAAFSVLAAACGSDGGNGGGTDVQVTLTNSAIELSPTTTPAGETTLVATNDGTQTHEFELFSVDGDADPSALPIQDNVANTDGLALVDEVEDMSPGFEADLTESLDPGTYAVICNLPGHYAAGMHATLTVE